MLLFVKRFGGKFHVVLANAAALIPSHILVLWPPRAIKTIHSSHDYAITDGLPRPVSVSTGVCSIIVYYSMLMQHAHLRPDRLHSKRVASFVISSKRSERNLLRYDWHSTVNITCLRGSGSLVLTTSCSASTAGKESSCLDLGKATWGQPKFWGHVPRIRKKRDTEITSTRK